MSTSKHLQHHDQHHDQHQNQHRNPRQVPVRTPDPGLDTKPSPDTNRNSDTNRNVETGAAANGSANGSVPDARPAIVVLAGNPRPFSRTRAAAERLAAALVAADGPLRDRTVHTIDLAELGSRLLEPESAGTEHATRRVTEADLLLVATPVFKGAYTGVLKVFLDRLPGGALAGVRTIPVTVAASAAHRYAADRALRPVLAELGADVVPTSFTLQELDLPDVDLLARTWVDSYPPVRQES